MMKNGKWIKLMNAFDFSENEKEYKMILNFYNEDHRKYHNAVHINDCLAKCELNVETKLNHRIHLAFWYHDVIYKPLKKDNEQKSADLAEKFLKAQNAENALIKSTRNLIMATLHNQEPNTEDEAYMMDIDISILGSDPKSYEQYTQNIRKEYKLIPWFIYKKKRKQILEMFLNKESLFYTSYFKNTLEKQARINIKNEINQLENA